MSPTLRAKDPFAGATIASLRLKPVTTISASSPCDEAIETMRDKGFDQLPVASATQTTKLVGLVTLGNLLSYISSGRAEPNDPVSKVMFDFTHLSETVTDPKDISLVQPGKKENAPLSALSAATAALGLADGKKKEKKRKFIEITRNTPLSALSRFFEWNSAAVVTEHQPDGGLKPIAIVTKVDLLSWMVRMKKHSNGDGLGAQ
jgi:cystathionine beta-synthase